MHRKKWKSVTNQERYKEDTDRLCCFAGMSADKSLCRIVGTGYFGHFPKVPACSDYLGEVPEESSGSTFVNRLVITKAGNSRSDRKSQEDRTKSSGFRFRSVCLYNVAFEVSGHSVSPAKNETSSFQ